MDTLNIVGLSVNTKIGVYEWEQRINQQLLIDIRIPCDFSACNEKLENTIDYEVLCTTVTQFVETKPFQLIESVAEQVACLIQKKFGVVHLNVSVSKPFAIKNAGLIQVQVER